MKEILDFSNKKLLFTYIYRVIYSSFLVKLKKIEKIDKLH